MKAMDIGYSIAKKYFEKEASFSKAAFYRGVKIAQEQAPQAAPAAPAEEGSMLGKVLPYLAAAGAGAGALYGGQKLYDHMTAPNEEDPQEQQEENLASYPEMYDAPVDASPDMYGAYDYYEDPYMYGAYDYYSPYDQYGAYDSYDYYM